MELIEAYGNKIKTVRQFELVGWWKLYLKSSAVNYLMSLIRAT